MKGFSGLRVTQLLAAFLLTTALAGVSYGAPSLGIDFTSVNTNSTNGTFSLGYEFNVLSTKMLIGIAFYDDFKNDLTEAHDIGVWDPSGTLIASGTVTPGSAQLGSVFFRWVGVAPVVLAPGNGYVVAGTTLSENYTWDPNGFSTDPGIAFVGDRFVSSISLAYPTDNSDVTGWFGGNIVLEDTTNVPEPNTVLLFGIGLIPVALIVRQRQQTLR